LLNKAAFWPLGVIGLTALSAIEQAVTDIKAKDLGVPVWQMLGGQVRDRVRVYNHAGAFEAAAKVSRNVQPGEVVIYHAWEPYQFRAWKGPQEPVEAPWKAIHLAGGYGHLHYRMFYGSPGHAPRGDEVAGEAVDALPV